MSGLRINVSMGPCAECGASPGAFHGELCSISVEQAEISPSDVAASIDESEDWASVERRLDGDGDLPEPDRCAIDPAARPPTMPHGGYRCAPCRGCGSEMYGRHGPGCMYAEIERQAMEPAVQLGQAVRGTNPPARIRTDEERARVLEQTSVFVGRCGRCGLVGLHSCPAIQGGGACIPGVDAALDAAGKPPIRDPAPRPAFALALAQDEEAKHLAALIERVREMYCDTPFRDYEPVHVNLLELGPLLRALGVDHR